MTDAFVLHEKLAAESVEIARLELSQVRLMNERHWPWLILVPRRPGLVELHDLDGHDRRQMVDEVAQAGRLLKAAFNADKINTAALGNMVPQLHVHVIARFKDDLAWPRPVWGVVPAEPYDTASLAVRARRLKRAFEEAAAETARLARESRRAIARPARPRR